MKPTAPEKSSAYEHATEGLRGLAALLVVYTHALAPDPVTDLNFSPSPRFMRLDASQGAVLLFFVLSGYVIGITNKRVLSGPAVGEYLKRRAVRLVPLYLIAVALATAVGGFYGWRELVGTIFFLQHDLPFFGNVIPVIKADHSLWTLNYEVIYYALFLLVWIRPRAHAIWLSFALLCGIALWKLPISGAFFATYAAGWAFWLAGYCLAQTSKNESDAVGHSLPWPSLALIWFVTWRVKPLWWIAHRFHLLPVEESWMNFSYFDFIPASILLLIATSGRRPKYYRAIAYAVVIWPIAFLAWRAWREHFGPGTFSFEAALALLAVALWKWRPSTAFLSIFAPVGSISYGIYIFHSPIQWFVANHSHLPSGNLAAFILRTAVFLSLTWLVAVVAEKHIQSWIKNAIVRKKARA